eukprot:1543273-Ditylum_brightwellii.AAC.1
MALVALVVVGQAIKPGWWKRSSHGKVGDTIQPMKESFIVAFLNWKAAKEEDMVVPKEITKYREKAKQEKVESGKNPTADDALSSALADEASSSISNNNIKCNAKENVAPTQSWCSK